MGGAVHEDEPEPETGEVRFGVEGEVEVFDGTGWTPYRGLPGDDAGSAMREDPETDAVTRPPGSG
ncbi:MULTISPECIES: hypothetical protein [Streptomyces]|uniref:Uncharacterized protein n=1 Tax=Streptomyces griseiscabiei TaxID=2993540 RepID=A0ABU4LD67_9ACTN|nr:MULTISPECIES: hypothetical protein [Streptomyces]MBZ3900143.1 hypothetical protein [Streptomyces griseiscabiei]MDX2913149.1 hypothetical protein [Streptomyces griseiscabiei]